MKIQPGNNPRAALVFAGGLGLGAYQAGAYQQFATANQFELDWLAGSSVGAVNAAIIAGNPAAQRVARLEEFWSEPSSWQPRPQAALPIQRYWQNWSSAIQTRLLGASGHFRPRLPGSPLENFKSFYDLAPMRHSIERLVDFTRLNSGEIRLTVATTDIETGEVVLFDTAKEKLSIEHLMASCGMTPEFPAVTIGDRLLGDGGLSANAPVEPILADATARVVFVLDLFARDGGRPKSLAAAVARKNELMFGNQTLRLLEFWRDTDHGTKAAKHVFYLSYQALAHEADGEMLFDLSKVTLTERWQAGAKDMEFALPTAASSNAGRLTIIRR